MEPNATLITAWSWVMRVAISPHISASRVPSVSQAVRRKGSAIITHLQIDLQRYKCPTSLSVSTLELHELQKYAQSKLFLQLFGLGSVGPTLLILCVIWTMTSHSVPPSSVTVLVVVIFLLHSALFLLFLSTQVSTLPRNEVNVLAGEALACIKVSPFKAAVQHPSVLTAEYPQKMHFGCLFVFYFAFLPKFKLPQPSSDDEATPHEDNSISVETESRRSINHAMSSPAIERTNLLCKFIAFHSSFTTQNVPSQDLPSGCGWGSRSMGGRSCVTCR